MKRIRGVGKRLGDHPDAADALMVLAEQQIRVAKEMRRLIVTLRHDSDVRKEQDMERDDAHGE